MSADKYIPGLGKQFFVQPEHMRAKDGTELVPENLMSQLNTTASKTGALYGYNLDAGLRKWRLAKARLDYGINEIINVNFVGDSITEGQSGAGTNITQYGKNYVAKLRDAFATKYGDVGEGWIGNRYPAGATTGRWTYTGTWVPYGVQGWIYGANGAAKTSTLNSTATLAFNGTGIKILFQSGTSFSDVTIKIDSGTAEAFNMTGADDSLKEYTKTGLTDGAHTVVITYTGTWGSASLLGAYEIKPATKGVRVNKMSVAGATIDHISQYELNGKVCIDYFNPKLTVFSFLGNDFNVQIPLKDFEAKYQTAITRAKQFGDVMITTTSGIFRQTTQATDMEDYRAILFNLAMKNNIAYVDIAKRFGDTWSVASSLGYIADDTHPKPEGHQDIFNVIYKILLEDI
jgi:hypothetical protein